MQNWQSLVFILHFAFSVLHFSLTWLDAVAVGSGLNESPFLPLAQSPSRPLVLRLRRQPPHQCWSRERYFAGLTKLFNRKTDSTAVR
jgi:hypothetical protein